MAIKRRFGQSLEESRRIREVKQAAARARWNPLTIDQRREATGPARAGRSIAAANRRAKKRPESPGEAAAEATRGEGGAIGGDRVESLGAGKEAAL
jgi:hypothetical protein